MSTRLQSLAFTCVILLITAAACSDQPIGPEGPAVAPGWDITIEGSTQPERPRPVRVYKFGPAGTYHFEASATGGTLYHSAFSLNPDGFLDIWAEEDPEAPTSDITVTEIVPADMQVDSIVYWQISWEGIWEQYTYTETNSVTVPADYVYGAYLKFYNSEAPDEPGTEGCTPGYWRQPHHFGNWVGYSPDQQFADVFEDAFPGMTLLDVVRQGGGGLNALGRHTVAALLNASGDVDYSISSPQDVIDAFNAVFPGGDYEGLKDEFEGYNEMGCSLGRAEADYDGALAGNGARAQGQSNKARGRR